jgi:formylglycine-generating enzyme required for sulfatase activity
MNKLAHAKSIAPATQGFRHSAYFSERLHTEMTDRQLLGLPEHFVATRDLSVSLSAWNALVGCTKEELCAFVESPNVTLACRLAAAKLLAETGDRRICVMQPQMMDVPGGQVEIGIHHEEVDAVMARFSGLGIHREWIEKETPRHIVALPPYRIGKYPVTNIEYQTFLRETLHPHLPTSWEFGRYPAEKANHPVYSVSPVDADMYASWLSRRTGRLFRLPKETEWEFAAAGFEKRTFPWGDAFLPDYANTAEALIFSTTPVGAFPDGVSPFGCFDMAGNVEEYVACDYRSYPGGPEVQDDLSTVVGTHRVARGGCFTRFRDLARTSRRHGRFPRDIYVMGFRLAEELA